MKMLAKDINGKTFVYEVEMVFERKRKASDIQWDIRPSGKYNNWKEGKIETRVGTRRISDMKDGRYKVEGSSRKLIVSKGRVNTRNVKAMVADMINRDWAGFDSIYVEGIKLLPSGTALIILGS